MSLIPNFPSDLAEEHHTWHMNRPIPQGRPGSGSDFLSFHHKYIQEFHEWYDKQPFADQAAVAPWTTIPSELKDPELGWNARWAAAEDRIVNHPESFASEDQLGIFIENGIHNWFHNATAEFYNDPILEATATANEDTHFYQIHGLIDSWADQWSMSQVGLHFDFV